MRTTHLHLLIATSLFAAVSSCGRVAFQEAAPSSTASAPGAELEVAEGKFAIVRDGLLELGDGETEWIVSSQAPLRFSWSLEGSGGRSVSTESYISMNEGPGLYRVRFLQEEVQGSDMLRDLAVLGGEEARGAIHASIPEFGEYSGFRYELSVEGADTQVETLEDSSWVRMFKSTRWSATSSSSGWIPGSVLRAEGGSGGRTSSVKGGSSPEEYAIGEPLYLAYLAELPEGDGSISIFEQEGELMIRHSIGEAEPKTVSLKEYEGRAWALKLTVTEGE